MAAHTDDIYHGIARLSGAQQSLAKKIAMFARRRIHRLFMEELAPSSSTTILDLGASDYESEETNVLEKLYLHRENITCAGITDGSFIRASYPEVNVVRIAPNTPLPFRDSAFDIAYSSAVLEHVGGPEQRRFFLRECARVARAMYIVVPNRWFPVDPHSALPVLHWSPAIYRKILRGTRRDYWAHRENLDFLDAGLIRKEWPGKTPPRLIHTGIWLGPLSSNIAIIAR